MMMTIILSVLGTVAILAFLGYRLEQSKRAIRESSQRMAGLPSRIREVYESRYTILREQNPTATDEELRAAAEEFMETHKEAILDTLLSEPVR